MVNSIEENLGNETIEKDILEKNPLAQRIVEKKKRITEILEWNDVTADDRRLIEKIEKEIEELKKALEEEFFKKIDNLGEVHGSSVSYSSEYLKNIAKEILAGEKSINNMTRSEGLRGDLETIIKFKKEK